MPAGKQFPFGPAAVRRLACSKAGLPQSLTYYEDLFPIDASLGLPFRLHNPGTHEIRLWLVLRNEFGSRKTETLEAAIRFNVVGVTFESLVLDYESKRVNEH